MFGLVLGGILTEYLSWHWCFFINVPVGIAAFVLGLQIIPKAERQPKVQFDLAGAVLIFTAMASLIYLLDLLRSPFRCRLRGICDRDADIHFSPNELRDEVPNRECRCALPQSSELEEDRRIFRREMFTPDMILELGTGTDDSAADGRRTPLPLMQASNPGTEYGITAAYKKSRDACEYGSGDWCNSSQNCTTPLP